MKGIDKFRMIINNNIRYIVEYQNVKRSKLAKEFNISETTFSHYFNNKAVPTIDFLIKFAEKFQISLDDLVKKDLSSVDYVAEPPAEYRKLENKLQGKENELLKKEINHLEKANEILQTMLNQCMELNKSQMNKVETLKKQTGGLLEGKKFDE